MSEHESHSKTFKEWSLVEIGTVINVRENTVPVRTDMFRAPNSISCLSNRSRSEESFKCC